MQSMTVDVGAQIRKGVVEYCALGLLSREPMYGWRLSEELVSLGMIASIGTLYPVLGRLKDRGLITSYPGESGSGPVRKYYKLTPSGQAELGEFRRQWEPFTRSVQAIVAGDDT